MSTKVDSKGIISPENWPLEFGDYLFSFAISRVYDREQAEDLVQETFLSALRNKHSFRGDSSMRTWLTAILKRKVIDYFRRQQVRKEDKVLDQGSPFQTEGIMKGHWDRSRAPVPKILDETISSDNPEFMKILRTCLQKIPPKQASIFTMKILEEMETEEVCKILDITPSNIWTSLHRGKLQIRECLEKRWFKIH